MAGIAKAGRPSDWLGRGIAAATFLEVEVVP